MAKRLDLVLCEMGVAKTRSRSRDLIKMGYVLVNGRVARKPGESIKEGDEIEVLDGGIPYVSRAALKLKHALEHFNIDVKGRVCLDVGSSTGGFTECLLEYGAERVYAVDVGSDQMDKDLRKDGRVSLFEGVDIRDFKSDVLFDFVSVDVSFISLKLILPAVYSLVKKGSFVVALVKPQFEVGAGKTKKGVVKSREAIKSVLNDVRDFAEENGFLFKGVVESPIKGKDGNREFLMLLLKP